MHRWNLSALAAAVVVSAVMTPTDASALALGRIDVQSALGEPLRAEIDIPLATAAELEALRAGIASPDLFRAQGMDYSSTARQIQVEVARRSDGSPFLRLHSQGPVNDPYVDLVIDANWNAGQLVRSYTLLLDPPASQRQTPVVAAAPQAAATPPAVTPPAVAGRTYSSDGSAPAPTARVSRTLPAPASSANTAGSNTASGPVTVRRGDTAGRIANANRPAGVSLDQMLVAMQRANPNAFINGNVNLIRAGSVVQMPTREAALSTSASEARQIVAAQSRDFNALRRRMATQAPKAEVAAANRTASGQVQAQVQDAAASAPAADKLTLSKGALTSQTAADEKLAQDKQASAQTDRMNELQRNLSELKQVAAATGSTAEAAPTVPAGTAPTPATNAEAGSSTSPALGVAANVPTENLAASTETTPAAPSATTEPAATAAATAPEVAPPAAPAATTPAAPAAAAPATAPEPASFMDDLSSNPLLLPAAGGVVALLLGLLGWRSMQRRKALAAGQDTSTESPETPDSLYAGSGGQQVDTHQSNIAGAASTMAYSPSQLDAGGDVDPVAEAEVYLAYGRDVQAEEILKEALRLQPDRLGVHMKLAEIYAKRKDAKAFAPVALAVQSLTQGTGAQWEHVQELGHTLDPVNPLYQTTPAVAPAPSTSAFAEALAKSGHTAAGGAAAATAATSAFPADLDLNLDMDLPGGLADQSSRSVEGPASVMMPSDQDFASLEPTWDAPASSSPARAAAAPAASALDLNSLEFDTHTVDTTTPVKPIQPAVTDPDISLDFGGLNLDLNDNTPAPAPVPAPPAVSDDPLSTKLDLAREFHAIGDSEGARTLVEEVIAEASGDLKNRAQLLLSEID